MRKLLNILLLVLTLAALVALSVYFIYNHFHEELKEVRLKVDRDRENGFIDYEKTYDVIMKICDTANNAQVMDIPVDSVLNVLRANPWTTEVKGEINLDAVFDIIVKECQPVMRIYNNKNKSVYLDAEGNIYPTNDRYTPYLLIANGNVSFPHDAMGNVADEVYANTDLPEIYALTKGVMADEYARTYVKQIYKDKKKNYIFSLNNTNIIVIFGDVNDIEEKLFKMKHFFMKMQGNPELDTYKEINLNFKNQVVCTKNK